MNKITVIGRLTADPELRKTQGNLSVCNFTVAVSRRFNKDETDFISVVAWKEMGENCNKYLFKGNRVGVSGALQTRKYEDKDGNKRTIYEILADEVEFLTQKNEQVNDTIDDNDMPF